MVYLPLQEFVKRRNRYLLNVFIMALTVMMIITLNSLALAYRDAAKLPFENIHSSIIVQKSGNVPENITGVVLPCSLAQIRLATTSDIRGIDGVRNVSSGLFLWVFDSSGFKRALGVDWKEPLGERVGSKLVAGSLPVSGSGVLVEQTYANQYGLSVNQTIIIGVSPFTITGLVASSGKDLVSSDVYMDRRSSQALAYASPNLQATERFERDDVNILFIETDQLKTASVEKNLKQMFANTPGGTGGTTPTGSTMGTYSISSPDTFGDRISTVFLLSDRLAALLSGIILIAAAILISKNMSHVLLERQKDFAVMKTVGWTQRDIRREIFAEIFIQTGAGVVVGIIVSFIAIVVLAMTTISVNIPWDLNPYPHFLPAAPELANTVQVYPLPIAFPAVYAVLTILVVFAASAVTAFFLVRIVNRIQPMEVLKYE
jgi:ABC-type antimicrobial peptide transport system permease subunit